MSVRCSIRKFEHFLRLSTGKVIRVDAAYCSAGLHETKVTVATEKRSETENAVENDDKVVLALIDWLDNWAGKTGIFKSPPICKCALKNGKGESEFERSIWDALEKHVPAGQIVSYAKLAELAVKKGEGRRYARAVGQIMRRNPLGLVRACHRVVPTSVLLDHRNSAAEKRNFAHFGTYAGIAESDVKRALLEFELGCNKK